MAITIKVDFDETSEDFKAFGRVVLELTKMGVGDITLTTDNDTKILVTFHPYLESKERTV